MAVELPSRPKVQTVWPSPLPLWWSILITQSWAQRNDQISVFRRPADGVGVRPVARALAQRGQAAGESQSKAFQTHVT